MSPAVDPRLQWQVVEMPLTGGLMEKAEPELQPFGTFARLENYEQRRDGSLQKRRGLTTRTKSILGGGSISAGARLLTRKDSLVLIDGTSLYSYSDDATAWVNHGRVPPCAVEREPVVGLGARHTHADTVYAGGFYVDVWEVGVDLYARVTSWTNGNVVLDKVLNTTGASTFKVCAVGGVVFVLYVDAGTPGSIQYYKLNTGAVASGWSGGTLPNATNLYTAVTTFDVCTSSTRMYVAYVQNHAGGDQIDIRAYDSAAAQQDSKTAYSPFGAGVISGLGVDVSQGDRLWVASALNDVAVIGLSPTNLATTSSAQGTVMTGVHGNLVTIIGYGSGSGEVLVAGADSSSKSYWISFSTPAATVSTTGNTTIAAFRMCPISRLFRVNGRTYIFVMDVSTTAGQSPQAMSALVDVTETATGALTLQMPRPVACPAPRIGVLASGAWFPGASAGRQGLASVAKDPVTYSVLHGVLKSTATGAGGGAASSLDRVRFDFTSPYRWMGGELGEALMFGPQPYVFDGANVVECGYWTAPNKPTTSSGAGALAAGNYLFLAIYECVHGSGLIEWSAPSPPADVFVADGAHNPTVVVQTLQVTCKDNNLPTTLMRVRIVLYASKDSGAYQRVTGSETNNNPLADTVSIVVSATDASAPGLYTTPGAQPGASPMVRQMPPPLSALLVHGDRYAGIDETGKNVWFSGQSIYGELQWFTSAFQFPVETRRPLIGLGSLDGSLFPMARDRIFVVSGDGPADNGAGFYGLPVEFPCGGAGCIDPRSVVATPAGLMYLSDQGIYTVSRGGEAQFIGAGVEQTSILKPLFTSAVVHPATAKVHFTCTDAAGANGRRPSFDLVHRTWTMDRPAPSGTDINFVSAVMVGGSLLFTEPSTVTQPEIWAGLAADGTVYVEGGSFLDASAWQSSVLQTGWIPFDSRQGFLRLRSVQLLALWSTGHDLTMSLAYNYNPTIVDTRTWTAAQLAAIATGSAPEQIEISCTRQKIDSVQVTISDATPSSGSVGIGKGAILNALSFEVKAKGGMYRLPAANSQ